MCPPEFWTKDVLVNNPAVKYGIPILPGASRKLHELQASVRHLRCATIRHGAGGTLAAVKNMLTLEDLKNAVRDSIELWNTDRRREAMDLLNSRIGTARQDHSVTQLKILAIHASIFSESAGDIDAAQSYLEQVVMYEPGNALALYRIAYLLKKQGKTDEADALAARSHSIAAASKNDEANALLELLAIEWPYTGHGTP